MLVRGQRASGTRTKCVRLRAQNVQRFGCGRAVGSAVRTRPSMSAPSSPPATAVRPPILPPARVHSASARAAQARCARRNRSLEAGSGSTILEAGSAIIEAGIAIEATRARLSLSMSDVLCPLTSVSMTSTNPHPCVSLPILHAPSQRGRVARRRCSSAPGARV
jgi:hypothetical protein